MHVSDRALACSLAGPMRARGYAVVRDARNLGMDYVHVAGAARGRAVQAERFRKLNLRVRRMKAVQRKCKKAAWHVARTGLVPMVAYGVGVCALTRKRRSQVRALVLSAGRPTRARWVSLLFAQEKKS